MAGFAPDSEMLAVVFEQVVSPFSKSTAGSFEGLLRRQGILVVRPGVKGFFSGKFFDWNLANSGGGSIQRAKQLSTHRRIEMNHLPLPHVDPVVGIAPAFDEQVISGFKREGIAFQGDSCERIFWG